MSRAVRLLLLLCLGGAALAAALLTRAAPEPSPLPSVDNAGPLGTRALLLALEQSGLDVEVTRSPLTGLPARAKVVVIAAPEQQEISADEVGALQRFVSAGGTLVYLAPRSEEQPQMAAWLELQEGGLLSPDGRADDPTGTSAPFDPAGGAPALSRLRVDAEVTVASGAEALTLAGHPGSPVLTVRALGRGSIWVGSGPDLAQARRLELDDNLALWAHLAAQGPVVFDELHHQGARASPGSRALWAFGAQLLLIGAVFALSRGARLGPARPTPSELHRPAIDSARAIARLTRAARLERELIEELARSLRRGVEEVTGASAELADAELVRLLTQQQPAQGEQLRELLSELGGLRTQTRVTPAQYLAFSQRVARLERALDGRGGQVG